MQAARVQSSRNRDTEGRRREEVLRWAAKGSRAGRGARQEDGGEGKEAEAFAFFKSSALPPPASATTAIGRRGSAILKRKRRIQGSKNSYKVASKICKMALASNREARVVAGPK